MDLLHLVKLLRLYRLTNTDMPSAAPKREQRYTVTPKPTTADADDDFGFNETVSFFEDAKNFDPEDGTDKLNQD